MDLDIMFSIGDIADAYGRCAAEVHNELYGESGSERSLEFFVTYRTVIAVHAFVYTGKASDPEAFSPATLGLGDASSEDRQLVRISLDFLERMFADSSAPMPNSVSSRIEMLRRVLEA